MGKLEGKIALVTGGNSGIGLATAKRFVSEGAYVFVTGRRDTQLAAAVREIGHDVTGIRGDVSDLGDLDRLFEQRPLPMRRDSRAITAPPGTRPAPTSNCDKMAFSRLANRMSQASASSLPIPVARPRTNAIDTTGARLRRTSISGHGCNPVGPGRRCAISSRFARKSK